MVQTIMFSECERALFATKKKGHNSSQPKQLEETERENKQF